VARQFPESKDPEQNAYLIMFVVIGNGIRYSVDPPRPARR